MARLYRRSPEGVWWTDIYTPVGSKRQSTGTKNKDLAQQILSDRLKKWDNGRETGQISLSVARATYLAYRKSNRNPKTLQLDDLALNHLPDIERLSDFTPELLNTLKNRWIADKRKPAAANRMFRSILLFVKFCEEENWIPQQKWNRINKPFAESRPRLLYYTHEEMTKLLNHFPDGWMGTAIRLGYYAGLRRSEMYHLKWADVDLHRKRVVVHPNEEWKPKSTNDNAVAKWVPLHDDLIHYLKSLPRGVRVLQNAPKPEIMSTQYSLAIRAVGFKGSMHTLRHTIASHLASAGTGIYQIKEFLRHSRIEQTMIYAKLTPESKTYLLSAIPSKLTKHAH